MGSEMKKHCKSFLLRMAVAACVLGAICFLGAYTQRRLCAELLLTPACGLLAYSANRAERALWRRPARKAAARACAKQRAAAQPVLAEPSPAGQALARQASARGAKARQLPVRAAAEHMPQPAA